MTPGQLAKTAAEAIYQEGIFARITLVTRPQRIPGFPRGDLLQEQQDGTRVVSYPAAKIIAWCAAQDPVIFKQPTGTDA